MNLYLSGRTGSALAWHSEARVRASLAAASLAISAPHLHRAIRGAKGILLCVWWGVTTSQFDLPSLTPLSVAGCG